jgi:hypothetical protein
MDKSQEQIFQKSLEVYYGCSHSKCIYGITDITTHDSHIEIKEWCCWKAALGQLLAYQIKISKPKLKMYLFGKRFKKQMETEMVSDLERFGVSVYHLTLDVQNDDIHVIDVRTGTIVEIVDVYKSKVHSFDPGYDTFERFKAYYDNAVSSENDSNRFTIDTCHLCKWLLTTKWGIVESLKANFVINVDYIKIKTVNPVKRTAKSNNNKTVLLTTSSFKRLCMTSRCKGADQMRKYIAMLT